MLWIISSGDRGSCSSAATYPRAAPVYNDSNVVFIFIIYDLLHYTLSVYHNFCNTHFISKHEMKKRLVLYFLLVFARTLLLISRQFKTYKIIIVSWNENLSLINHVQSKIVIKRSSSNNEQYRNSKNIRYVVIGTISNQ